MNIEPHKRILSFIHIVTGSLNLLLILFFTTMLSVIMPFIQDEIALTEGDNTAYVVDMVMIVIKSILYIIGLIIALPSIIGGIALLNGKQWGFVLLMISGCLSLLNIPFGTAKGIYTLWVYFEDQKLKKVNVEN